MHATSFTKAFAQQSPVCIIPPKIPCISFFILNFLYFPSSSFYPKLRIFSSFVFSCLFLHSPASFPNQQTPIKSPLSQFRDNTKLGRRVDLLEGRELYTGIQTGCIHGLGPVGWRDLKVYLLVLTHCHGQGYLPWDVFFCHTFSI